MLSQPDHYTKKQGLSAFLLFLIVFLFAFLHGFLIMSSLPIALINSLNFVFPLLDLCTDPQKLDQKSNFGRSVFLWLNIVLNSR
ncbi:hypothetical protein SAMN04487821_117108 [Enterococcus malodoratus]|nr:hypothetical protein SAMN04487821_117108 [Enterococcus malodoratus]